MKRIGSLIILLLILSTTVLAAAPKILNFQGRLVEQDGTPVTGQKNITFSLYNVQTLGTALWSQTLSNVALDSSGVFNVILGGPGNVLDGVNFDQDLWMEVQYSGQVFSPRQRITAAPTAINAINGVPVGTILPYGGTSAPGEFLMCNGDAVDRIIYADLFAVIGTNYGVGDNVSTFNLPDMRGIFPKGAGTTNRPLGKDASGNFYASTLGIYYTDKTQGHVHGINTPIGYATGPGTYGIPGNSSGITSSTPINDGTHGVPRIGYTTEPQSVGVNFIIKH